MDGRFEAFTVFINRISRNIRKIKNGEMAEYNLRSSHISCLYYIYAGENVTAKDLCERCEEDKATISRALDYLEKEGYVTRESRYAKGYKGPMILTEKGQAAGKKIAEKIDVILEEINAALTEEERLAFYHSLAAVSKRLENLAEQYNR